MSRPATPADLDAVHALFVRWADDVDEPPLPYEPLQSEWRAPGFDPARDHWLEVDDGEVVGYAALKATAAWRRAARAPGCCRSWSSARASAATRMLEAIMTTRDDAASTPTRVGLAPCPGRVPHVARTGRRRRAQVPDGVAVRTYAAADARPLHAFLELAYAQNNERVEPFEPWLHFMTAHATSTRPSGTWPSRTASWPAAASPGRRSRAGAGSRTSPCTPSTVGVASARRCSTRRIARTGTRGVDSVGLKVDSDNPTARRGSTSGSATSPTGRTRSLRNARNRSAPSSRLRSATSRGGGAGMGIGVSIILIAAGAILTWAVNA